jgi:hypothetical protein
MYSTILLMHSLIRWVALIVLIAAVGRAWAGFIGGK